VNVRTSTVFLTVDSKSQTGAEAESATLLDRLRLCENNPRPSLLTRRRLFAVSLHPPAWAAEPPGLGCAG